jgi:hypothetical protein
MSPEEEMQRLLYSLLTGFAPLMTLISGVYDRVPKEPFGAKEAYISFGPSDASDESSDCILSGEYNFQLDCWSRKADLDVSCRRIVGASRKALRGTHSLAQNALVSLSVPFTQVFRDPDGLTSHGVVRVRAIIEETE